MDDGGTDETATDLDPYVLTTDLDPVETHEDMAGNHQHQLITILLCIFGLIMIYLKSRTHNPLFLAVTIAFTRIVVNAAVATVFSNDQVAYYVLATDYSRPRA
jgi:hypothetical protein